VGDGFFVGFAVPVPRISKGWLKASYLSVFSPSASPGVLPSPGGTCGVRVRPHGLGRPSPSFGCSRLQRRVRIRLGRFEAPRPASPWTSRSSPNAVFPGGLVRVTSSCGITSPSEFSIFSKPRLRAVAVSLRVPFPSTVPVGAACVRRPRLTLRRPQGFDPLDALSPPPDLPGVFHPGPSLGFYPSGLLLPEDRGGLSAVACLHGVGARRADRRDPRLQGLDPLGRPPPTGRLFDAGGPVPSWGLRLFKVFPSSLPVFPDGHPPGLHRGFLRIGKPRLPPGATNSKAG